MSASLRSTPGRARVRVPYLKKRPEETPGSPAPCAALRPHRSSSLKIRGRARSGTPQGAAEVGDRIREQLGVRVDPQVGSGTFCIDLGVRHTENGSRYILGIECDGKAYHNAPAARAYDLWRQRILEECGWGIIRIWSTSWRLPKWSEPFARLRGFLRNPRTGAMLARGLCRARAEQGHSPARLL